MKTSISLIFLSLALLCSPAASAQNNKLKSEVHEGVELVSIVFRLAEAEEYSQGAIESYNNDIHSYFAPYKDHEVVKLAKEYRKNYGMAYNAIVELGIHLETDKAKLKLSKDIYYSLDPLWNNDSVRWNKPRLELFTKKLNDFYKETKFNEFFTNHAALYADATEKMDKIAAEINMEWFESFYGVKFDKKPRLGLLMGDNERNYGLSKKDKKGNIQSFLLICVRADSLKMPAFDKHTHKSFIVHELSHPYINPMVNRYPKEFEKFDSVISTAYKNCTSYDPYTTWPILIYESLVRASTYKYFEENGANEDILASIKKKEIRACFLWINEEIENLTKYQNNRDKYPTLESYIPQIIANYEEIVKKEFSSPPNVIYSSIEKGAVIDAGQVELTLKFSKEMDVTKGPGFNYSKGGKESFPEFLQVKWLDNKTVQCYLRLQSNKEYSLYLYKPSYVDLEGSELSDNFFLNFKTK